MVNTHRRFLLIICPSISCFTLENERSTSLGCFGDRLYGPGKNGHSRYSSSFRFSFSTFVVSGLRSVPDGEKWGGGEL